jgi:prepilin-type processing-associated H-X9-DG protein
MKLKLKGVAITPRAFQRTNHGGFTMMDLLVVIGTTGIVVVILLPTLGFSKAKSQVEYCLSNFNQLAKACAMYTSDNQELYPPNPDDGNTIPGYAWVEGDEAGWMPNPSAGGAVNADNADLLRNPATDLLANYLGGNIGVFKCPADPRIELSGGKLYPVVRSVSCNQGVGTVDASWLHGGAHSGPPTVPVPGPWLIGIHAEAYSRYATFGKTTSFKNISPSDIWTYVDDDPWTINDDAMAVIAAEPEWIDYPSTMHQNATGFAFADGHSEMHHWQSNVLIHTGVAGTTTAKPGLQYNDWYWWAWHATRSSTTGSVP